MNKTKCSYLPITVNHHYPYFAYNQKLYANTPKISSTNNHIELHETTQIQKKKIPNKSCQIKIPHTSWQNTWLLENEDKEAVRKTYGLDFMSTHIIKYDRKKPTFVEAIGIEKQSPNWATLSDKEATRILLPINHIKWKLIWSINKSQTNPRTTRA